MDDADDLNGYQRRQDDKPECTLSISVDFLSDVSTARRRSQASRGARDNDEHSATSNIIICICGCFVRHVYLVDFYESSEPRACKARTPEYGEDRYGPDSQQAVKERWSSDAIVNICYSLPPPVHRRGKLLLTILKAHFAVTSLFGIRIASITDTGDLLDACSPVSLGLSHKLPIASTHVPLPGQWSGLVPNGVLTIK
ncbi:hypothetical protein SODALDRAFT_354212 [Sodiomyces alkalinus F11]|uniref:Uncharacterized protein n=1 Tax=Sodiomyces alkalinus (strain CBS 110278 / VKM F-3762 / F11) TaxID=1314773 RepID=A0A3N2Q5P2_SODAK|nr:hypothetical protein SODALDRAFT_354212 [Sodiomyces alkalinus F11]ROT42091.1 hypothetical protein SODALDRAFT_354212 [Sodiomyces alkalinus F11]